jgi:glycosyltransferase involved in cell wall biosynthesis
MRIAYLIDQYPAVSHSFIRREILALERQGFEVVRISLRGWDDELVDPDDERERERTRYVLRDGARALLPAFLRVLFSQPARLLQALVLACRMSRRSDRALPRHMIYLAEACCILPWLRDVAHLHAHFATNSAEVAMLAHVLGGPRWSFTVHGTQVDNPQLFGMAHKLRRCTFVVAISSYARGQFYRFLPQHEWRKVHVVHCGLESTFDAENTSHSYATRQLVCVARLSEAKGHLLLVQAAALLQAQGLDFELVLAGDGELRADIEALIARHELQARVRLTGWISGAQVRQEILAARALVLPSFAEGLPVTLMEAMALRRPVISTFIAGIPELVVSGEHGWLVPAGDVDALAQAMRACLEASDDTLARMGQAARRRVLARHDVDVEASKLAALFRDGVVDHSSRQTMPQVSQNIQPRHQLEAD